jgi:hypothetical protein
LISPKNVEETTINETLFGILIGLVGVDYTQPSGGVRAKDIDTDIIVLTAFMSSECHILI